MKVIYLIVLLFIPLISNGYSIAGETVGQHSQQAIVMINHINLVVSKILNFNDILVLEQEYENVNTNNLNLETIKDQETIDLIKTILDSITAARMNEGDREIARKIYDKQMSKAIHSAFPSPASIISPNPYIFAANVLQSSVKGYMDFKSLKEDLALELKMKTWELDKNQMIYLNDLHKDLLDAHWRLVQRYSLPDSWRVTAKDAQIFIERMKDTDNKRRYEFLNSSIKKYNKFPIFWYYLGIAQKENGELLNALKSFENFDSENMPILRRDSNIVSVEINRVMILLDPNLTEYKENEKSHLNRFLGIVSNEYRYKTSVESSLRRLEDNLTNENWRELYFCALAYLKIGNIKEAERVLRKNINNLEYAWERDALHEFIGLIASGKAKPTTFPSRDDIAINRILLASILEKSNPESLKHEMQKILENDTYSNIESLYYTGKVRGSDVLKRLGPELDRINLTFNNREHRRQAVRIFSLMNFQPDILRSWFIAKIPMRWFYTEGLSISLEFYQGQTLISSVAETIDRRQFDPSKSEMILWFSHQRLESGLIRGGESFLISENIDRIDLFIEHAYYPTRVRFDCSDFKIGFLDDYAFLKTGYEFDGKFYKLP